MSAPTVGYSPWQLYGPCDCGAQAGQPCLTGPTGAARLVVHHSRRPVDDVTGAGFTPVLTAAERRLLAAVHRWARQPKSGSYCPRWERSYYPGWWKRVALGDQEERAEVTWGPVSDGQMTVEIQDGRYGEKLLDESVRPRSVREAVDLLVVWGILPAEFSSLLAPAPAPDGDGVQDWWFTFGSGQPLDGRYVVIRGTWDSAREEMFARFGNEWSMHYESAERAGVEQFRLIELPERLWPPRRHLAPGGAR